MANSADKGNYPSIIQKGFHLVVLVGLLLVILSRLIVPATSLLSVAGAFLILVIYGLVGYFGFSRIYPKILNKAGFFGLLAGAVFAAEIILEYAILPQNNTSWGVIEFGGVFSLFFLSGLVIAFQRKSIKNGILAAIVSSMFSSVIWLIFILLTFYIFRGTARQEMVFMAEGNYADFARSGMTDFNTFVMEDFLGAGFFHLLLAPIIASIFGTVSGMIGKGIAQITKHNSIRSMD